ncbi:M23 family metallopeptidase [Microbacterium sp. A84]|uniref:M23 family metallopeptidase n=1 Tax=Microbacterium sp. A84 TaxID=3450715 RepID=UPI003F43275B
MAEPVATRRTSRHRTANSANPVRVETTSPMDAFVQPLSRRAVRERQRAAMSAETQIEDDAVTEDVEPDADVAADPFLSASRAFRTVATEPSSFGAASEQSLPAEATTIHVAPRKGKARRKFLAAGATVGVMGIAGLLAVSMTLPTEAVAAAQGAQVTSATSLVATSQVLASEVSEAEIQAYVASSDVQNETIQRTENFSTASLIDLAAEKGIHYSSALYTNDADAAIQWPFVVGVAMSSPYGMRNTGMHEGIDLVPGAGAPVQVIADGTVRIATESGGNYGVTVYVDHIIDGKVITSHYSHMQYGSLRVAAGEKLKVGDIIGLVGNTGRSYGAHMHFELIVNGSTIDPLPWLQKNAGRYDY